MRSSTHKHCTQAFHDIALLYQHNTTRKQANRVYYAKFEINLMNGIHQQYKKKLK